MTTPEGRMKKNKNSNTKPTNIQLTVLAACTIPDASFKKQDKTNHSNPPTSQHNNTLT